MKLARLKSLTLLAFAAASLALTPALKAVSSNTGDLFLGVRAGGGAGATQDYVIDIGPASQFEGGTSILTLNLGSVGTDLSSVYGSGWNARSDVFWGIAGTTGSFASVGSDPAKTLFATREETTVGTQSTPWVRQASSTQGVTTSKVSSMQGQFNGSNSAGVSATNAVFQSDTDTNSWASFQSGGTLANSGPAPGISFAAFNPTIEGTFANGTSGEALDLYRMQPGSGNGDYLGRFVMSDSGQLSFIPVAAFGSGTATIQNATYSVTPSSGTLNVTVTRSGDTASPANVTLSSTDVSATAGTDYTAVNQVVSFDPGVTSQIVPVTILPGSVGGTFTLSLSTFSIGLTAGANATSTVTIANPVVPSVINLAGASFNATQHDTSVTINLVRSGGTSAVSVNIATAAGTAIAGTDYVTPTGSAATVTFNANVNTASATITLIPATSASPPDKQFTVSLTSPGTNASVGSTQPMATVHILADDTTPPSVVISSPAANAVVPGAAVTISGSAFDNKEVSEVTVSLNGGTATDATLAPNQTGATWSLIVTAAGGLNTVKVIAYDAKRNASPAVTRSFTYTRKSGLTVTASPSIGGTVTGTLTGINPYTVGSTYTLTATPKTGYVFNGWTVPGLTGPATQVSKLTYVFNDTLANGTPPTITASFVLNPFKAANTGAFNGLVTDANAATASNSTTGFINVVVTGTGTFTGTLKIDGFTLKFSGLFDNTGVGLFGVNRDTTVMVPRTTKPALVLALSDDLTGGSNTISGTVKQYDRTKLVSTSNFTADQAAFSAAIPILGTYTANRGLYTVALPLSGTQTNGLNAATDYPQGTGVGSLTVTAAGVATFAGTLADGTAVMASAPVSKHYTAPLYAQLYTALNGSFSGLAALDLTQTSTDVSGAGFHWFRPWTNNAQYYPWGWDEGVSVDLIGAQYASVVGSSVLKKPGTPSAALSAPTSPNGTLVFSDGGLASSVSKLVSVSPSNAVSTGTPPDASFGLTITAATGKIAGTFTNPVTFSKPLYQGIILQKGLNAGAYGFFLTVAPKVADGTGLSGNVSLIGK